MAYDFKIFNERIGETKEWLKKEYLSIRTSRATPALLDNIQVISYSTRVALNQVANVSVEDARTLRISPYDISQLKEIEKAITDANLGVGVGADEGGIRITFPEITSERRQAFLKVIKEKLEEARVSLRGERDQVWDDIQKAVKEKTISEDEKFRYKNDMQKIIDGANKELDEIASRKEKEIAG